MKPVNVPAELYCRDEKQAMAKGEICNTVQEARDTDLQMSDFHCFKLALKCSKLLKMSLTNNFKHLPDTLKCTLDQSDLPKVIPQICDFFSKAG